MLINFSTTNCSDFVMEINEKKTFYEMKEMISNIKYLHKFFKNTPIHKIRLIHDNKQCGDDEIIETKLKNNNNINVIIVPNMNDYIVANYNNVFACLPQNVKNNIFKYLDYIDIINIKKTSRHFIVHNNTMEID